MIGGVLVVDEACCFYDTHTFTKSEMGSFTFCESPFHILKWHIGSPHVKCTTARLTVDVWPTIYRVMIGPSYRADIWVLVERYHYHLIAACPEWTLCGVVAWDGIEPPTHAFSGRCSTD